MIEADMAMTAKILKLVNSAFFCLPCEISRASHAVKLLGLDTLQALVLTAHVFEQFESHAADRRRCPADFGSLSAVSNSARRLRFSNMPISAPRTSLSPRACCMMPASSSWLPLWEQQYGKVLEYSAKADRRAVCAEREVLGCSHGQIAAYLFGVWGLPGTIVEAVAWHHEPAESLSVKFSPLAAVHVASVYHDEKANSRLRDRTPIDTTFLAAIGCADRESVWRSKLAGLSHDAGKLILASTLRQQYGKVLDYS